jgi:hypothetical protein
MSSKPEARTTRRRAWRVSHVAVACLGLSAIFAVGFYTASSRATAVLAEPFGPPAPRNATEAGLRTATIWVSSAEPSDQCRQLTFDNFAGAIRDQGRMHCNDTFSQPGAGSTKDSIAGQQIQSVREGFTRR